MRMLSFSLNVMLSLNNCQSKHCNFLQHKTESQNHFQGSEIAVHLCICLCMYI